MPAVDTPVTVHWLSADGAEHEETWGSVDAFTSWAEAEGLRCRWTAYQMDEDGDGVVIARGRIG